MEETNAFTEDPQGAALITMDSGSISAGQTPPCKQVCQLIFARSLPLRRIPVPLVLTELSWTFPPEDTFVDRALCQLTVYMIGFHVERHRVHHCLFRPGCVSLRPESVKGWVFTYKQFVAL